MPDPEIEELKSQVEEMQERMDEIEGKLKTTEGLLAVAVVGFLVSVFFLPALRSFFRF